VEFAELVPRTGEDPCDCVRVEFASVRRDAAHRKPTRVTDGLETPEKRLYVLFRRIPVQDLVGEPAELPVVDYEQNAERAVVYLVRRDVSREAFERLVEVAVTRNDLLRFFPPTPRPSSGSSRTG
jgi:hypothetical protein